MSPYKADPNINYIRLRELSDEFTNLWKRLQSLYLDASIGFLFIQSHANSEQIKSRSYIKNTQLDSEDFLDSLQFSYGKILSKGFCTSSIHKATIGEVKARNATDGANFTALGQLILVSFYHFWNDYFRREYVVAKGKLDEKERDEKVIKSAISKYAKHDLWGDIGYLRQSIVHNHGIAISKVSKCKYIEWFKPGNPIDLTPEHMRVLFLELLKYRNELFAEQFPKHFIPIPLP